MLFIKAFALLAKAKQSCISSGLGGVGVERSGDSGGGGGTGSGLVKIRLSLIKGGEETVGGEGAVGEEAAGVDVS